MFKRLKKMDVLNNLESEVIGIFTSDLWSLPAREEAEDTALCITVLPAFRHCYMVGTLTVVAS